LPSYSQTTLRATTGAVDRIYAIHIGVVVGSWSGKTVLLTSLLPPEDTRRGACFPRGKEGRASPGGDPRRGAAPVAAMGAAIARRRSASGVDEGTDPEVKRSRSRSRGLNFIDLVDDIQCGWRSH